MSFTPKHLDSISTTTSLGAIKVGEGLMIDQYGVLHVNTGYGLGIDAATGVINYTGGNVVQGAPVSGIPTGNGNTPVVDSMASYTKALYHFNEGAGLITFVDEMNHHVSNTNINSYAAGTGGAFDDLGVVQCGVSDSSSVIKIKPTTTSLIVTNDFCIEGQFFATSLDTSANLFSTQLDGYRFGLNQRSYTPVSPLSVVVNADGSITFTIRSEVTNTNYTFSDPQISTFNTFYQGSDLVTASSNAGVFVANTWNHVALVRGLGHFKVYLNGLAVISTSDVDGTGVKYKATFGHTSADNGSPACYYVLGSSVTQAYPDLSTVTKVLNPTTPNWADYCVATEGHGDITRFIDYSNAQNTTTYDAFYHGINLLSYTMTGSTASTGISDKWFTATNGNGVLLGTAWSGSTTIIRSTDGGSTWVPQGITALNGYGGPYFCTGYGNGNFVLNTYTGYNNDYMTDGFSSNFFATSPDGVTWTQRSTNSIIASASTHFVYGVVGVGNVYLATYSDDFMYQSNSNSSYAHGTKIKSSTDGVNWSAASTLTLRDNGVLNSPGNFDRFYLVNTAVYGNGIYLVSPTFSSTLNYQYFTSTDAVNWTARTITPSASTDFYKITSVMFVGGKFYIFARYQVHISTDGVNWTEHQYDQNQWGTIDSVAWNGSRFLATSGTADFGGMHSSWYTSTDATSWVRVIPPTGVTTEWWAVTAINGNFVALNHSSEVFIGNVDASAVAPTRPTLAAGDIMLIGRNIFETKGLESSLALVVGDTVDIGFTAVSALTANNGTYTVKAIGPYGEVVFNNKQAYAAGAADWLYQTGGSITTPIGTYANADRHTIVNAAYGTPDYPTNNFNVFSVNSSNLPVTLTVSPAIHAGDKAVLRHKITETATGGNGYDLVQKYVVINGIGSNYNYYVVDQSGALTVSTDRTTVSYVSRALYSLKAADGTDFGASLATTPVTYTNSFKGYIDEFRITDGVPRYITNFVAPKAVFKEA